MNTIRKFLFTALALTGFAVSTQANPVLGISDGTTTIWIQDNGAGDSAANSGQIMWFGSIGTWNLNVSTGVTTGDNANPIIDLSSSSTSTGAGTLSYWYGDNNFGASAGVVEASIGGTLNSGASLWFRSGFNTQNNAAGTSSLLTDATYTGNPAAFSGTEYSAFAGDYPYALVMRLDLTHTVKGTSSYDANVHVPDSASTGLLIILGLTGIGFAARRNKSARV